MGGRGNGGNNDTGSDGSKKGISATVQGNRDRINAKKKEWNAKNPDRLREYRRRYWERVSLKSRASWEELGISKERREELMEIAKKDEFADIVLKAALKADRLAAGHIVLSVTRSLPYERIEHDKRLGRVPLGRTDFYGARRLFFYYLDELLKGQEGRYE